jgi:hypothetical protein
MTISPSISAEVLTTAIEGGIGYWAQVRNVKRDASLSVLSFDVRDGEDEDAEFVSVTEAQVNDAARELLSIGYGGDYQISAYESILAGDFEDVDFDADTADAIVQQIAFGKQVFG